MTLEVQSTFPLNQETLELIETHRQLALNYGSELAQENDSYSLAQPSPYRYVPTVASNQTAPLPESE